MAIELRERGTVPGHELDEIVPGPPPGPVDPLSEAMLSAEPEGEPVQRRGPRMERSP